MYHDIIIIAGPTSTRKDRIVARLIDIYQKGIEIISIDSMKVYKGMDIGTSKPAKELLAKGSFHLIDIRNHWEGFNVYQFYTLATEIINTAKNNNKIILGVAGTPLYLKVLLYGIFKGPGRDYELRSKLLEEANILGLASLYNKLKEIDPDYAGKISENDSKRIIRALEVYYKTGKPFSAFHTHFRSSKPALDALTIEIIPDKKLLHRRIEERTNKMLETGLVDEVKTLLMERPFSREASQAIGYKEVLAYLNNEVSYSELPSLICKDTEKYVKQQLTWLKKISFNYSISFKNEREEEEAQNKIIEIIRNFAATK